jgi:hypothetical protein
LAQGLRARIAWVNRFESSSGDDQREMFNGNGWLESFY